MGNFVVGIILAAVVVAIIVKLVKDKKAGKTGCGCGCDGCGCSSSCHEEK